MAIEFHMIWRDQLQAVSAIRQRHGEEAAFDYIVDEKLMNFAEAAEGRPEFARELPRFVAAIRETFPAATMRSGLQRLAHYLERDKASTAEMAMGTATPTTILKMRKRSRDECCHFRRGKRASSFCVACSSPSSLAQPEAAYGDRPKLSVDGDHTCTVRLIVSVPWSM